LYYDDDDDDYDDDDNNNNNFHGNIKMRNSRKIRFVYFFNHPQMNVSARSVAPAISAAKGLPDFHAAKVTNR